MQRVSRSQAVAAEAATLAQRVRVGVSESLLPEGILGVGAILGVAELGSGIERKLALSEWAFARERAPPTPVAAQDPRSNQPQERGTWQITEAWHTWDPGR